MDAETHREAVLQFIKRYNEVIGPGGYVPNNFPLHSLPFFLCFGFLLLPQRFSGQNVRQIVVSAVIISAAYNIFFTRARDAAWAGGVGILNAYLSLWAFAHIGAVDAKKDYARIKMVAPSQSKTNEIVSQEPEYTWQGYPSSFLEKLNWILDLFISFEGMGWQWGISSLSAPPERVQTALQKTKSNGQAQFPTQIIEKRWSRQSSQSLDVGINGADLYRRMLKQLLYGYLALDLVKSLGSVDPYFYGQIDAAPPSYLPRLLRSSFVARSIRLLIAEQSVHLAIQSLLLIPGIYFLGNHDRSWVGTRSEAWMFPSSFGSFRSVLDHGLAGFWSNYWHQSFRYIFIAPSNVLLHKFQIPSKSPQAKILRLFIAFFCSGILHSSISYTAIGSTYPIRGPMLFFLLQPFGILTQFGASHLLQRFDLESSIPDWLSKASNLCWCLVFGYFTGPLLIDDFARGGSLLYEPVPFSIFRGLGLGNVDDGIICWRGPWYTWHRDGWKSGIIS